MKSKALLVVFLALAIQLNAPASPVLDAKLSCVHIQSDITLILQVKNEGPDTVRKGTTVYYWYKILPDGKPVYGSFKLPATLTAGQINNHNIDGAQALNHSVECAVSLNRFRGQH